MYQTIITLKQNLSSAEIEHAHRVFTEAFNNHVGKLENKSTDKYRLLFEDHEYFGVLSVGEINVFESELGNYIDKWTAINPYDPSEDCDDVWGLYSDVYQRNVM